MGAHRICDKRAPNGLVSLRFFMIAAIEIDLILFPDHTCAPIRWCVIDERCAALNLVGLNRDSNPGPLAPKARIIPLDH